jgi:hypothetical protein
MAFNEQDLAQLRAMVGHGHVLVVGPIGSGKLTFLSTALAGTATPHKTLMASSATTEEELFMARVLTGAGPGWAHGPLAQAMAAGHTILIADADALPLRLMQLLGAAMAAGGVPADSKSGRPGLRAAKGFRVVATTHRTLDGHALDDPAFAPLARRFGLIIEFPAGAKAPIRRRD